MKISGNHKVILGKNVIKNKEKIIEINKGKSGLKTFSIDVPATPTPTKRTEPTGGVQRPMHKFKTSIIPNCIGSIPILSTIGRKIGVNIKTAGVISMKIPTNKINKLIIIKIISLLSLKLTKKLLNS